MPSSSNSGAWVSKAAARIVLIYLLAGSAWILISDELMRRLSGPERLLAVGQFKGLLFVGITSLLLFFLLSRAFGAIRRSQEELAESEQRFVSFMAHVPAGAFLKDTSGRYVYVNDYWREQVAGGRDSLGQRAHDYFPKELAQQFEADDRATIESGQPHERLVTWERNGSRTRWMIKRFPLPLNNGRGHVVAGFAVDISERERLEEQMSKASQMEAVGRVAGGMAHDFNNLLTVINGYAELLARRSDGHGVQAAKEILAAGERASTLTRQLLAFSRSQILDLQPLDLNAVITGIAPMLLPVLGGSVELKTELVHDLPLVRADRAQMEQALLNLAANARDAMARGGTFTIATSVVPDRCVVLTVKDTGEGMDEATRERIFEPFFTTKPKDQGTGLGLSTVYGVVRQCGGTITVTSAPGKGATFDIFLPAHQPT